MAENYRRALTEEEIPSAFKNVYGDRTKKPISVQTTEALVDVASPLPTIVDIEKELDKKDPSYTKIAGLAGLELLGSAAPVVELAARSANKSVLQKIVNYFKKNPDKEYNPEVAKVSAKDLGFGEDVYHFTTSKKIKGDKFNPNLSIGNWNRMGIHVGAKKAAADRFRQTQAIDKYKDGKALTELSPGEFFETNPKGMTIPLKVRTDKPLLFDGEIQSEFAIIGKLQEMALKRGIGKDGDYATALRKELAKEGYTHIPYINEVENEGAISYIMLTDRPKGSSAVMRSRFADFDPDKIDKPELGLAEGGDTMKPEPRPDIVDVSPMAEAPDQDLIKKDDSFPDVKPKQRPEGRSELITRGYEIDGREVQVGIIKFKGGEEIALDKVIQNIDAKGTANEPVITKNTVTQVLKFLEERNPTREEFETYWYNKRLNKGGALMEEQMQMAFMSEGGLKDDGMDKDPVSGNEVPSGSMAEEVRDDIPAQLSEGEYVVPADVVRYYGVKFFEDLRDQAKMGLAEMEANGRIGGEPVPAGGPVNDEELSPEEMQAIREVMGMAEGGDIQNPYMQQQLLYSQPRPAPIDDQEDTLLDITNPVVNQMPIQNMAVGGQIQGYQTGGLEQSFLNAGQSAVNRGFVGFPLGATIFPSERTGQTVLGPTGTQVVTTDAIDTAATAFTTVTLYGPNGEVVVLTLPTDIDRYNELIALGYTTIMPGVTTTTTTDSDDAVTTDDDDITTITTGTKRKRKIDKPDIDPNSWMKKFDYTGDLATNNLAQQTSDELKKAPVGGVIGAFINGQNAAQAAANIIILENNGGDPTKIAELKAEHQKFIKDTNLSYLPDQLINGDALAKDIVKNNIDIALNRDSKDINNKPIFKDDNDFNNFMQEVAPEGMTFDPSITSATTNNAGETVTVQGGYTRKGSATPTVSPRPSSIVKPTPPTEPISTPTASDLAAAKAVDDALAAKALEDKIERDRAAAKEAARIAARDRRKKKSRIEKENLAARSINPYDIDPAAINKGGLMAKGKKKK